MVHMVHILIFQISYFIFHVRVLLQHVRDIPNIMPMAPKNFMYLPTSGHGRSPQLWWSVQAKTSTAGRPVRMGWRMERYEQSNGAYLHCGFFYFMNSHFSKVKWHKSFMRHQKPLPASLLAVIPFLWTSGLHKLAESHAGLIQFLNAQNHRSGGTPTFTTNPISYPGLFTSGPSSRHWGRILVSVALN